MVTFFQNSNGSNPDVSVIIPTYNRLSMLKEALVSVIHQQFDGVVEIIVIDDNSQDGTSETISQMYSFVHLLSLKHNLGSYVARNRGILKARGKYIAFLDSDDLWKTNYLKTQISALEGKEKHFAVSDVVIWDTVKELEYLKFQKPNLVKFTSPIHHLLVSTFITTLSSVIIPRKVFWEVGLFDEEFRVGGDTDLYLRSLSSGYEIIFTEMLVVIKREHGGDQLTDPNNLKIRENSRFRRIKKFYSLYKEDFNIPLRRIYAETYAYFGSRYLKNRSVLYWFVSIILVFFNSSFMYGFSIITNHTKSLLNKILRRNKQ